MAYTHVHWVRSAEQKRAGLDPALTRSADDLAQQVVNNPTIGRSIHRGRRQLQGLRITIEYTFQGHVIQIEDVYENR